MIASPLIALAGLALVGLARPAAWPVALPVLALWAAAPFVAHMLSRPPAEPRIDLTAEDRAFLTGVARKTWRYFETFVGPDDHGLPARQLPGDAGAPGRPPDLADEHRHGAAGDARRSRPRLHRPRRARGADRRDAHDDRRASSGTKAICSTGTTRRRWRRCRPRYISTVDSGNLVGALMALAEGLHQAGLDELGRRAAAFAEGTHFRFLYDPQRQIFSIGYRLADQEGPGHLDPSYYDLLASEARLASFIAIAQGRRPGNALVPPGTAVTSVGGTPTLLSWSGTLFEYLMPLPRDAQLSGDAARRRAAAWRCNARSSTAPRGRCPGASRSPPTTSSIVTAPTSTRPSASPASG